MGKFVWGTSEFIRLKTRQASLLHLNFDDYKWFLLWNSMSKHLFILKEHWLLLFQKYRDMCYHGNFFFITVSFYIEDLAN